MIRDTFKCDWLAGRIDHEPERMETGSQIDRVNWWSAIRCEELGCAHSANDVPAVLEGLLLLAFEKTEQFV